MQNLLNIILFIAVTLYSLTFLANIFVAFSLAKEKPETVKAVTTVTAIASEAEILLTTVSENIHQIANPANKTFERVTVAQMKAYIADRDLKESLELKMNKKLYKANKRDIYLGLQTI